jgi:hypothetical protein
MRPLGIDRGPEVSAFLRLRPSRYTLAAMPKISPEARREIERALREYEAEVEATNLSEPTKKTYLGHTREFVRWLNDDFTPGEKTG